MLNKSYLKSKASQILSVDNQIKLKSLYIDTVGLCRLLVSKKIPLEKLLWGGEHNIPAARYSRITDNFLRPSTPLRNIPHVAFLEDYKKHGDIVLEENFFKKTSYYNNAAEALDLAGEYFGCKSTEELVEQGRRFIYQYNNDWKAGKIDKANNNTSSHLSPIIVRKIAYSSGHYEIVDGHHRLAIKYAKGATHARAYVLFERPVLTPLQEKLLDVFWTKGRRLLYQPIDSPELGKDWPLVRKCEDRMNMIKSWLKKNHDNNTKATYLDIGCSYGWFLREMNKLGIESYGVDRDTAAIELGRLIYNLKEESVKKMNIVPFLQKEEKKYTYTSCFSVIHHFALGKGSITAEDLLGHIDRITDRAFFFDTGQSHEQWFSRTLPEWDVNFIIKWVKNHSSFTSVEPLGEDMDWQLPGNENNYRRTLFVCTRK